jgi:hypothetical protein
VKGVLSCSVTLHFYYFGPPISVGVIWGGQDFLGSGILLMHWLLFTSLPFPLQLASQLQEASRPKDLATAAGIASAECPLLLPLVELLQQPAPDADTARALLLQLEELVRGLAVGPHGGELSQGHVHMADILHLYARTKVRRERGGKEGREGSSHL